MIVLSSSAFSILKTCPIKYRNAYVFGIRKAEEPDPLRIGSNWHAGLEAMSMKPEQPCPFCSKLPKPESLCPYCIGTGYIDDPDSVVTRVLNHRYETLYPGMLREAKEVERVTILYSLFAYKLHWDSDNLPVIAREIPFRIPLIDPRTRRAVPNVMIDGMIDKLVLHDGKVKIMEHKSTGDSVESDSEYWLHLRLDTQTMLYPYAVQRLQADGLLEPWVKPDDPPISDVMYDVWHKPQISPKKLSQADTAKFIESGEYFGQTFDVKSYEDGQEIRVDVDGNPADIEVLKKGFAVRETPEMFGCRLFRDIDERPDYYFARKPINRSSIDLERFERELFAMYQAIEDMKESDSWYHNEHSCDNRGKCDYRQFCYTGTEIGPDKVPDGFVNIFNKRNNK
jgi:hypothetical protein